jgi:hypothetical protein
MEALLELRMLPPNFFLPTIQSFDLLSMVVHTLLQSLALILLQHRAMLHPRYLALGFYQALHQALRSFPML